MCVTSLADHGGAPDETVVDKLRSAQIADQVDGLIGNTLAHILATQGQQEFRKRAATSIARITAAVAAETGYESALSLLTDVISSIPT